MRYINLILVIFLIFRVGSIFADEGTLVVNKARESVSKGQVKMIFKGQREEWPGGGKAIVLLNSDKKVMESFCKKFLGMSYEAYQEVQVQNNIRSGKAYPRKVSTKVMITLISKSKNFI
ncbi:MAG: hypothetical protein KDK36_20640, partial [Leptospiraceae bacterium]|nr:hypothetical protein [Leptospiraceae bacterium]